MDTKEYMDVIENKTKFTNAQIMAAANNPELEGLVIIGLTPLMYTALKGFLSNKQVLCGTGFDSTINDLLADAQGKVLQCIRTFVPNEEKDSEYTFYHYMYSTVHNSALVKLNTDYRPIFRDKHNRYQKRIKAKVAEAMANANRDQVSGELDPENTVCFEELNNNDQKAAELFPARGYISGTSADIEDEENSMYAEGNLHQLAAPEEKKIFFDGVSWAATELRDYLMDLFSNKDGRFTEREAEFLRLCVENTTMNMVEIAALMGVTKQRVEQIRNNAAIKMKRLLSPEMVERICSRKNKAAACGI